MPLIVRIHMEDKMVTKIVIPPSQLSTQLVALDLLRGNLVESIASFNEAQVDPAIMRKIMGEYDA
jgi:hypothetical protein